MKLQVSSVHQGHDQAQVGLVFIDIRKIYNEETVNLLKDLLLQEGQSLATFLLQASFVELLTGIHLAGMFNLHCANL